jgi:hypothetical protein
MTREAVDILTLRVYTTKVFKPRAWLGTLIARFGFWIAGARAEALR